MMVLWVRFWFAVCDLENRVREPLLEAVVEIPVAHNDFSLQRFEI